jgi:hypothetical protein
VSKLNKNLAFSYLQQWLRGRKFKRIRRHDRTLARTGWRGLTLLLTIIIRSFNHHADCLVPLKKFIALKGLPVVGVILSLLLRTDRMRLPRHHVSDDRLRVRHQTGQSHQRLGPTSVAPPAPAICRPAPWVRPSRLSRCQSQNDASGASFIERAADCLN